MIKFNGKNIQSISMGSRRIAAVFTATHKVWEAIRNCIARGYWQHGHGWQHGTGWGQKSKRN